MVELVGFSFTNKAQEKRQKEQTSFVPPQNVEGALEAAVGDVYGLYYDLHDQAGNESELVTKYRQLTNIPEVDTAVDDVVNEAIYVSDIGDKPVEIVVADLQQPASVKKAIKETFEHVIDLLDFNNMAYDIVRKFYVDGRLNYHMVINPKKPKEGLKELRYVDPRKIRLIRKPKTQKDERTGAEMIVGYEEFFLYDPRGIKDQRTGIKIARDAICRVTSGMLDEQNQLVLGWLHKALKTANQLKMLEDAVVIYRITRAPERRIFYIDTGNLPKMKAEQYLRDMMVKHKNRLVYDAGTGEIKDDRKFMTMMEDYWLPRREGGKGTEISTLPGGENLGRIEDIEYFKRKLYRALNVPISRLEADTPFSSGRATELSRDEVRFSKFVARFRNQFSILFDNLLETHLVLTGVCNREEWKHWKQQIHYQFAKDNFFTELKDLEVLGDRVRMLQQIEPYIGTFYSKHYVRRKILRLSDEEIKEQDAEIENEKKIGDYEELPSRDQMGPGQLPPEETESPDNQKDVFSQEQPTVKQTPAQKPQANT